MDTKLITERIMREHPQLDHGIASMMAWYCETAERLELLDTIIAKTKDMPYVKPDHLKPVMKTITIEHPNKNDE